MVFFLCSAVRSGLSPFTDKSPRSRAASGGCLQEEPRPAPCEAGPVRGERTSRSRGEQRGKGPENDLNYLQTDSAKAGAPGGFHCERMKHDKVRVLRPVSKLNCAGTEWNVPQVSAADVKRSEARIQVWSQAMSRRQSAILPAQAQSRSRT